MHGIRTTHAYRAFFLSVSGNSISIDGESFPRRVYPKGSKRLDRTLLESVATDSRHSSTLEETGHSYAGHGQLRSKGPRWLAGARAFARRRVGGGGEEGGKGHDLDSGDGTRTHR